MAVAGFAADADPSARGRAGGPNRVAGEDVSPGSLAAIGDDDAPASVGASAWVPVAANARVPIGGDARAPVGGNAPVPVGAKAWVPVGGDAWVPVGRVAPVLAGGDDQVPAGAASGGSPGRNAANAGPPSFPPRPRGKVGPNANNQVAARTPTMHRPWLNRAIAITRDVRGVAGARPAGQSSSCR